MESAAHALLVAAGFDTEDLHLAETPQRVAQCWLEDLLTGHNDDPATILAEGFPCSHQDLIVVRDIQFHGMCPHHLLPFYGKAHIAYVPTTQIVGFSDLAALVQCCTRRFTLQEIASAAIVDALMTHLNAQGAGCVLEAEQLCMKLRGDDQRECHVTTTAFRGSLLEHTHHQQLLLR